MGFPDHGVQSIGVDGRPSIWFQQYKFKPEDTRGIVSTLHIGIEAKDTAAVDAFHAAALYVPSLRHSPHKVAN